MQVSWSPVAGAAYYRVYRVKADSLVKNNDIGGRYTLLRSYCIICIRIVFVRMCIVYFISIDKDSGLQSGKTYYYKIVPIATSESGADIAGKASKVKSVKAK